MIHLLWCTIRPTVFTQMYSQWMSRCKDPSNIKTHVAVNTVEHFNYIDTNLKEYKDNKYRIISINSTKIGVCYPSYQLSSTTNGETGDIVVFASDDFYPPQNWDEYLTKTLEGKEGGLMVRDGYQLPDSSNMLFPAITIPILTWGCFEKLNKIIYNPAYSHMYSDCELYMNLKDLGMLIDNRLADVTTFEHLHHASGKRSADQMDVQYSIRWKEDESTWNKRKLLSVNERVSA